MRTATATVVLLAGLLAVGCTAKRIPGLSIELEDNPDNRALIQVIDAYRKAFETKDVDALLALASDRFYEDSGTADTEDDYNYEGLEKHFADHFKHIKKVQLNLDIKKVVVEGDQAHVDYRYVVRYLMDLPSGEKWQVTDEINRMELVKQDGTWKVISGF